MRWILAGLGNKLEWRRAKGTVIPRDISFLLGNMATVSNNVPVGTK